MLLIKYGNLNYELTNKQRTATGELLILHCLAKR